MKKELINTKISQLRKKIHQWNDEYFNKEKPSVSDEVYDAALVKLTQLETQNSKLLNKDAQATSPTRILGSEVDPRFQKHHHKIPMLSLNKAYTLNDLERFNDNVAKKFDCFSFFCEPKIDGLSISLHYVDKKLALALTRGNGIEGEDVTHNVKAINVIPKTINYSKPLEIRGEIYLDKKDFEKINANLAQKGEQLYANARNLASGTMRQLDSKIVSQRNLSAFFYSIVEPQNHNFQYYSQTIEFLKQNKFPVNPHGKKVDNIQQAFEYINHLATLKDDWGYDVDGMVIKVEQLEYYQQLGFTSKFPHSAIAYKFASEIVQTKLLDIFPTVGRTGIITYNAVLEPAFIGGTIVSAATLHNYTYIEKLKISIGDIVKIKKAGEIIPKVLESINPHFQTNYPKVTNCPECKTILRNSETQIDQFCINPNCPEVNIKKMIHFASKAGINIEGLAESQIRLFYKLGFLKSIPDLFDLPLHKNEILALEGFKQTSVNNLINALEKSKNLHLHQLIAALGIKNIGSRNAKFLAEKIPDLEQYLHFDFEKLIFYNDIGPITIAELKKYFSDEQNIIFWKQIQKINWQWKVDNFTKSTKLNGITFAITGTLSQPRNKIADLIEIAGAKLVKTISKTTNYLIVGQKPSSKLQKAQDLGIGIINEADFLGIIDKK